MRPKNHRADCECAVCQPRSYFHRHPENCTCAVHTGNYMFGPHRESCRCTRCRVHDRDTCRCWTCSTWRLSIDTKRQFAYMWQAGFVLNNREWAYRIGVCERTIIRYKRAMEAGTLV